MSYDPIGAYGLVGNLETCALVGRDGGVDWLPVPHVESPSVFARVLDHDGGGHFTVVPRSPFEADQAYVEGTAVLETTFETDRGAATLSDFMPVATAETGGPVRALYRAIKGERGTVEFDATVAPRFDYATTSPSVESVEGGILARGDDDQLGLWGTDPLRVDGDTAGATFAVEAGETHHLVLGYDWEPETVDAGSVRDATVEFWRDWGHDCNGRCVFGDVHHDLVVRSEVALKLLTHRETGAIVAAPTTSLPETVGGVRNWDYRYNWIRDAAFTVQALANLGHREEADAYFEWFLELCHAGDPEALHPLYGLHGDTDLTERTADHLEGYRESRPVRIGNAASDQLQLDVYGELVEAIYQTSRVGASIDADDWDAVRDIVDHVCEVWDRPDKGIWEVRCGPRHFVHSKLMCWVALDRGLAIAEDGGFDAPTDRWRGTRGTIRETILAEGYDDSLGSFVRAFDERDALDATALLIPVVGFLPADDPRVEGTIDAVRERLGAGDGLLYRYEGADGLPGGEGAFLLCSFWLVDALALAGRLEEATETFETVLEHASEHGLLAEEVDPETGALLGNYPQAFSHLGVLTSALLLGCAKGRTPPAIEPRALAVADR